MSDVLSRLEPEQVFYYFGEICKIPHGSFMEGILSDYIVQFAEERGLSVWQDEWNNVVIKKNASPGYEGKPPVILQGHLDMVCEKSADSSFDFIKDSLELFLEGDFLGAKGTTLGGDDGIAVAYCLALLDAKELAHPPLEIVFTVQEEVGMDGAREIDLSMLKGNRLINIDSEEEGILLTGCAGGCRSEYKRSIVWEEQKGLCFEVAIEGLIGGHSGVEIHKERGNAAALLGRFLLQLEKEVSYSLGELSSGLKDNAIPRTSKASILIAEKDRTKLEIFVSTFEVILKREYRSSDPNVVMKLIEKEAATQRMLSDESKEAVLLLMNLTPNGVQRMSTEVHGLVETSLNLGVLDVTRECAILRYAVRSSIQSAKENLVDKMRFLAKQVEADFTIDGDYPAWEYRSESPLRETMKEVYLQMYGSSPKIKAIHAGLECGLLTQKIQDLDCVSFGPNMKDIHTTEERISISSTKRMWEYLCEVLRNL